ncbi:hypothetical protein FOXB_11654 [Fusarium oxysporum f. sp. conglutinans Fo5176]|uniref:Cystathionine beta-synthase n=3 Tax=Fusarium oxysporum TaxID=5507 RepID=A0A8H5AF43_FUSOX|nr:hypothetical protein FOXB_11654 [Fusarium oxysporum f. sp. conglutinans Fo5176]KAF5262891.1 hypothetical protein FOXYS1_6372 [Fusarium oxysporum]
MATATATTTTSGATQPLVTKWSSRYRGRMLFLRVVANASQATVEDLDPPAALSLNPSDAISLALMSAFERDYTHLTIVDADTRALLGYISIPHLQSLLDSGKVKPEDQLSAAMTRFQRKGRTYQVITMETTLEELENFFRGGVPDGPWKQEFAVITDEKRRFVLGVATVQDLEEFVKRRPE